MLAGQRPVEGGTTTRKWLTFSAVAIATAMTALDITIVSVALPTIQDDLGLDQLQLQWVVNAYLLVVAAGLGIAGRLADMRDRTWIFRIGIVVFVGASLLAGLAQDPTWLIAARAAQGAGYALLIPVSLALLLGAFGSESSGRAMGLYYATVLAFTVLGPLIGGVLVEIEWRAIFFVNVPVGIAALILIGLGTTGARTPRRGRMDWTGAGLLSGGIVALVVGFMQAGTWGWASAATLAALGLGVVLLGAFWMVESRTAEPLVDVGLFRTRRFLADNLVMLLIQFGLMGLVTFGAIYVQNVLGLSALEAGATLLVLMVPLGIVSLVAGRIYDRIGGRAMIVSGTALSAAGLFWTAYAVTLESYAWLVPGYVALGIGLGAVMSPASADALSAIEDARRGTAAAVLQLTRQVGGAVGLGVVSGVVTFTSRLRLDDLATSPGVSVGELEQVLSADATRQAAIAAGVPSTDVAEVLDTAREALVSGIAAGYLVSGIVVAAAAVLGAFMLAGGKPAAASEAESPTGAAAQPADPLDSERARG